MVLQVLQYFFETLAFLLLMIRKYDVEIPIYDFAPHLSISKICMRVFISVIIKCSAVMITLPDEVRPFPKTTCGVAHSLRNISSNTSYSYARIDHLITEKTLKSFILMYRGIGESKVWDMKIYPGMKQGILGILRTSQDIAEIPYRKNCFEVYGADFLLSEDFTPWLIEINMSPCLDKTSKVTAQMCPRCLQDCLKGTK